MSPADSPFALPPAPGPHPAPAELRAYAAGTLAPADEHRIEAHSLECERCAELLEGFAMSDAATTDQALATLRARLQARVGSDLVLPAAPLAASRPLWPRLAAAVALLGAVGAGLWGWQHQPAAEHAVAVNQPAAARRAGLPAAPPASGAATTETVRTTPAPPTLAGAIEKPGSGAAADSRPLLARPDKAAYAVATPPHRFSQRLIAVPRPAAGAPPAARTAADGENSPADAPSTAEMSMAKVTGAPPAGAASAPVMVASVPNRGTVAPASPATQAEPAAAFATGAASEAAVLDEKADLAPARKTKAARAATELPGNSVRVLDQPMPASPAIAPAPVDGSSALYEYLRRQAAAFQPKEGTNRLLGGHVKVRFVVQADGKVSNLQVVRGLRADYDSEALRIICEGPAWRPGITNGRRAALPMELMVNF